MSVNAPEAITGRPAQELEDIRDHMHTEPPSVPARRLPGTAARASRHRVLLALPGRRAPSPRGTPTRRLFPRLSGRRSPSADLPVRGCYRGTRCEPGCPRRNAGIGRSAVYRSVCSAGRGEWCHHVIAGCQGACWRALFEPGVRLTRRRDCGPRARDDRRPQVKTGAAQVAAPT